MVQPVGHWLNIGGGIGIIRVSLRWGSVFFPLPGGGVRLGSDWVWIPGAGLSPFAKSLFSLGILDLWVGNIRWG